MVMRGKSATTIKQLSTTTSLASKEPNRSSDYSKSYYKSPVVNRLLLYKPLLLAPSTPKDSLVNPKQKKTAQKK